MEDTIEMLTKVFVFDEHGCVWISFDIPRGGEIEAVMRFRECLKGTIVGDQVKIVVESQKPLENILASAERGDTIEDINYSTFIRQSFFVA